MTNEIAKIRKEAARDLGILYKTRPDFAIVNALKEAVSLFELIEV